MILSIIKNDKLVIVAGALMVVIMAVTVYLVTSLPSEEDTSEEINSELQLAAEDLNSVLPQRLAMNTYFDSVGVSPSQLHYFYSISDFSEEEFIEKALEDSLYEEAVNRIPCTLWRPDHMNGVEVTFTYFSNDDQQILTLSRFQDQCH